MKRLVLITLFLFSLFSIAYGAPRQGASIAVELPSNPSTGYQWTYTMNTDTILKEEGSHYIADASAEDQVGAGGKQVWVFRALNEGSVSVTFKYSRPWEAGASAGESVTYFYAVDSSLQITEIGRSSSSTIHIRPTPAQGVDF